MIDKIKILPKILLLLSLSSCWSYQTTNHYSDDFRTGYSTSKPIYLTIKNTEKNRIYFLLERNINNDDFFIKMRWVYKNKVKQFRQKMSNLRFLVDNIEILDFQPIKPLKIISYHLEPAAIEEEAVYHLTREDMEKISAAKTVTLEIKGYNENKIATFNSIHTFKAFRDFLKNS